MLPLLVHLMKLHRYIVNDREKAAKDVVRNGKTESTGRLKAKDEDCLREMKTCRRHFLGDRGIQRCHTRDEAGKAELAVFLMCHCVSHLPSIRTRCHVFIAVVLK